MKEKTFQLTRSQVEKLIDFMLNEDETVIEDMFIVTSGDKIKRIEIFTVREERETEVIE